eukprot:gnl/Carplike_NY0171/2587_a3471_672.p1 GENE.gnl/Carplike_NY0171/2587_a3471_672~~gnl/Carplike_NY0171/2587_a3471_672.p1  ORF type:complete len:451 (+),score=78.63 gnl/Carplike_NY0171/2587_a3471_672:32-1384(+)
MRSLLILSLLAVVLPCLFCFPLLQIPKQISDFSEFISLEWDDIEVLTTCAAEHSPHMYELVNWFFKSDIDIIRPIISWLDSFMSDVTIDRETISANITQEVSRLRTIFESCSTDFDSIIDSYFEYPNDISYILWYESGYSDDIFSGIRFQYILGRFFEEVGSIESILSNIFEISEETVKIQLEECFKDLVDSFDSILESLLELFDLFAPVFECILESTTSNEVPGGLPTLMFLKSLVNEMFESGIDNRIQQLSEDVVYDHFSLMGPFYSHFHESSDFWKDTSLEKLHELSDSLLQALVNDDIDSLKQHMALFYDNISNSEHDWNDLTLEEINEFNGSLQELVDILFRIIYQEQLEYTYAEDVYDIFIMDLEDIYDELAEYMEGVDFYSFLDKYIDYLLLSELDSYDEDDMESGGNDVDLEKFINSLILETNDFYDENEVEQLELIIDEVD